MVNQWGRDGSLPSQSKSSGAGTIISVLIALMLGGAGGYGGARFFAPPAETVDTESLERIKELEKTISDLRFNATDGEGLQTEIDEAKARISELEADNARIGTQLDAANQTIAKLKKNGNFNPNEIAADAKLKFAELELAQTRRERDQLSADLARAQDDIRALRARLDDTGDASQETLARKDAEIEALKHELAALDTMASTVRSLKDSLRTAEAQIRELTRDLADKTALSKALEAQLDAAAGTSGAVDKLKGQLQATQASLRKAEQARDKAVADLTLQADRLATLTDQVGKLQKRASQLAEENKTLKDSLSDGSQDAAISALEKQLAAAKRDKQAAERLVDQREVEIQAMKLEMDSLEKSVADLKKELAAATKPDKRKDQPPADDSGDETGDKPQSVDPRDPDLVDRALSRMPGVERLDPDKLDQLRADLEGGACVTNALDGVYDRVPILALRNLLRDLRSPC